jgi:hypothetical protein
MPHKRASLKVPDGGPKVKYVFSGHETFPFRYTWLPKGVTNLLKDPELFARDDALVTLGVGKNMVRFIRHWCTAAGAIERVGRTRHMKVKDLGLSPRRRWVGLLPRGPGNAVATALATS